MALERSSSITVYTFFFYTLMSHLLLQCIHVILFAEFYTTFLYQSRAKVIDYMKIFYLSAMALRHHLADRYFRQSRTIDGII